MVSLSVLAVNVHRLGCLVRDQCGASVSEDARRRPTPPQKSVSLMWPEHKGQVRPTRTNTTLFEP